MSEKSSNTAGLALATVLAALVTGAATLVAAKMITKVEAHISGRVETLSVERAGERIEQLSKNLEDSQREVAALQERIGQLEKRGTNDSSGSVRSLLQRVSELEGQVQRKDELIARLQGSRDAPEPPPSGSNPGSITETKRGVTVTILGCQYSAKRITCAGTLTQNAGGYNHIVGGSDGTYLWDTQSNQYPVTRVRLGANEGWRADGDLPAGVPTRFELTFEAIPEEIQEVKALLIATYQQKFQFENIPLTR